MTIHVLAILLLATCIFCENPPNIIVILSDDQEFNDVLWHNDQVISPHLSQLATEGIILEQHYSQSLCSPTRGALLTGRYPINIGLNNGIIFSTQPHGLNYTVSTIAERLGQANYSTHAVGKWHLGFCNEKYLPTRRGFDHHYGYYLAEADYFDHSRKGGYDFRNDDQIDLTANGSYSTKLFQDRAVKIIKEDDSTNPLFLYVHFQGVHAPLQVPDVYRDMYSHIDDEERRAYLGMVTVMNDAVGNITQALKDSDLYDNSIIVFLSDNGGPVANWPPIEDGAYASNNWPLRGGKYTLWEGGTRTLAFIHSPKYLEPRVEQGMMHVTDWFPTLLSATGLPILDVSLDGVNLWPNFVDSTLPYPRQEILYNIQLHIMFKNMNIPLSSPISAIRMGNWKYIRRTIGYSGWDVPPKKRTLLKN